MLSPGTYGRGAAPRKEELNYLGYLAGWRCQFSPAAAKDLQRESLSGTPGNFSYFAHIVASSPKGPRGDKLLSGVKADDIRNIMLMCDECHRRIDRVDPGRFTVDVLNKMRQGQHQRGEAAARLVAVRGGHAPHHRGQRHGAIASVRPARRGGSNVDTSPQDGQYRPPNTIFYNGGRLHKPARSHTTGGATFDSMVDDVPLLRKRLNGTLKADGTRMPVAVFPLHGTSLLVLAGRIVGEGSRVTVFQYKPRPPE